MASLWHVICIRKIMRLFVAFNSIKKTISDDKDEGSKEINFIYIIFHFNKSKEFI